MVRVRLSRRRGALFAAAAAILLPALAVGQDRSATVALAAKAVTPSSPIDYRIGPLDKLNIVVFQVKDLSVDNLQVDASGQSCCR